MTEQEIEANCEALNAIADDVNATDALTCHSVLEVGIFFDGIGRNLDKDSLEGRLSNIARMHDVFPDEMSDQSGTFS